MDDPYDYEDDLDSGYTGRDVDSAAAYGFFFGCLGSMVFWAVLAGILWWLL
jgi:hypothetical protein